MKMKSLNAFRQFIAQQVSHHAHTCTGIIQISLYVRILRIDAQSAGDTPPIRLHHRVKTSELRERVEGDMATATQDLREISRCVGRGIGMCRTPHLLQCQTSLKLGAGCRKWNIFPNNRENLP